MTFNSLRIRFLFGGFIALIAIAFISYYSQDRVKSAVLSEKIIAEYHNIANYKILELIQPLLELQKEIYRYTLTPQENLKNTIPSLLKDIEQQTQQIIDLPLVQENPQLLSDVTSVKNDIIELKKHVASLLSLTQKERFPSTALMLDKITPTVNNFNAAMLISINSLSELEDEKKYRKYYSILTDLRYIWTRNQSAAAFMVGGITGVFNETPSATGRFKSTTIDYINESNRLLGLLKTDRRLGLLPFELTNSLDTLVQAQHQLSQELNMLVDILDSPNWRMDLPILINNIDPMFIKMYKHLKLIETHLEQLTTKALRRSTAATERLSHFLWVYSASIVGLFAMLFGVFEIGLRRPILSITEAMEAEGKALSGTPLKKTGLQEIDILVDAFRFMQEQVRQRQQLISSILDNVSEAIITITDQGTIQLFNQAAGKTFGYSTDQVIGQNINILMPETRPNQPNSSVMDCLHINDTEQLGKIHEITALRQDKHTFPAEISTHKLIIGSKQLFISAIRDISDRKSYEQKLELARNTAENASKLMGQKNADLLKSMQQLKNAQEQLIAAEKMASLGGLVAGISHEINTPVGIGVTASSHLSLEIKKMGTLLDSGELTKTNLEDFIEEANEASGIIMNNLNRAAELIRSFKRVAVDQTSEETRHFNMRGYLDEVILNLRPKLKRSKHKIKVECPNNININGIPGAYSQILTNLVMNSLIHAYDENTSGEILINVKVVDNDLHILYRDNGNGMSAESQKHIFDPFFTTKRGQGGSGLGMHVVFNLVTQSLNGKITCQSEPGKGTEFIITAPIQ